MKSATVKPSQDECDQDDNFKAQLMIMAGVAVVIGLIVCLAGYKLFKCILFLTGFFAGFFGAYVMCSIYLDEKIHGNAAKHKDQIYLGMSFAVGIISGILTLCVYYVGLFVLGATFGWFAAMAMLPFLKSESHFLVNHVWLPHCICVGCAILGGLAILCLQKIVIIAATAFLGALLFINGLDYYVEKGKVLNFIVHILQGKHLQFHPCWYTWVLLSILPILCIVGIIVQHVKTSKGADHRLASGNVLVVDANQMIELQENEERAQGFYKMQEEQLMRDTCGDRVKCGDIMRTVA